jgi:hypothetical protein
MRQQQPSMDQRTQRTTQKPQNTLNMDRGFLCEFSAFSVDRRRRVCCTRLMARAARGDGTADLNQPLEFGELAQRREQRVGSRLPC